MFSFISWVFGFTEDDEITIMQEDIRAKKLNEYRITSINESDSESNTIICNGHDGKSNKLYFKIGVINSDQKNNIDYELYVYEQLHKKIDEEPDISKYFMNYDQEISGIMRYTKFVDNINMSGLKEIFLSRLESISKSYPLTENSKIVIIATYDYNSISFKKYLDKLTNIYITNVNRRSIFIRLVTIMILIINSIKILKKININHNDMHSGNILIIEEKTQYKVDIYNEKSNILNSDIKILIYDFDLSYVSNQTDNKKNLILNNRCVDGNGCNEFLSNRDYFFFIQLLCGIYITYSNKKIYTELCLIILNLLKKLIPNGLHETYIYNMIKIFSGNAYNRYNNKLLHWSASCIKTNDTNVQKIMFDCNKQLNANFDWVQDIPRLLNEYILELNNESDQKQNKLTIVETPSLKGELNEIKFRKKYLKYKYKYLKLHNQKNAI
jgi:hypothetical protein